MADGVTVRQQKRAAAERAVENIADGMVVGLGTGSTAELMVEALAKRVAGGLRVQCIPTSDATEAQARRLCIPITSFAEHPEIDLTIDGADEVDPNLRLIKGLGGALLREKIVASASRILTIIVDESKLVDRLGLKAPIPVEVVRFGWEATAHAIKSLGCAPTLRLRADGQPFVTDGGNYIIDCAFARVITGIHYSPTPCDITEQWAARLDSITGVVEHGLFLNVVSEVVVGRAAGVEILRAAT